MLGVNIHINGQTIYSRTAVNRGNNSIGSDCYVRYETDTGEMILHRPEDGAVVLAKKLLDSIKEQK